jgi:cell division protease FtsH
MTTSEAPMQVPGVTVERPRRIAGAFGRVRGVFDGIAYIIGVNRRRVLVLFSVLLAIMILTGASTLVQGVFSLLGSLPQLAISLAFAASYIIFQFGILFWFLSRPRKYTITPDDPQIGMSFANYRGQPDLLEHARSTVNILQGVKEFEVRGGEMPKGLLLAGRPGTGKTFLAACIAAEANLPFIYIDASSLRGMFWGMTELMVIKLFRDARGLARRYAEKGKRGACIVFMDEIDSIGMNRGGGMPGGGVGMAGGMMMGGGTGLNTLLNQMDSLGEFVEDRLRYKILRWLGIVRGPVRNKPLVFVIGATNRPEVLDPALTRPGRLDRSLEVYPPDAEGRRDIIRHYLAGKAFDPAIDVEMMVADSIGWTPIQIKTTINEALIKAHDDGRERLTYKDWLAAADERSLGLKQPIREMLAEDTRAIAYHEAGHAVAAHYLQPENRLLKATIIRSGDALGVVQRSEREERHTRHARQIETDIMVSLGSRAVEEVLLGTKMAGASSDLANATRLAMIYCADLGMGTSLLVVPTMTSAGYPLPVARMADSLLELLMSETKRLVQEKEYAVHAVAGALMEKGELIGEELDAVFEAADAANPEQAAPFQRHLVVLPKLFQEPAQAGAGNWPVGVAADAQPAAVTISHAAPADRSAAGPAVLARARWRPEEG